MINRLLLATAFVTALLALDAPDASASSYTPIQPGAPVSLIPGPAYPAAARDSALATCTLNFVFRGRGPGDARGQVHSFIGTAGHCMTGATIGQRVASPEIGEFGRLAFRANCALDPCAGRPPTDDFALLRIDDNKLRQVSAVVRGTGKRPRGHTTSANAKAGDALVWHGSGGAFSVVGGVTQPTSLESQDKNQFVFAPLVGAAQSGSPVVRVRDGKAVGVYTVGRHPSGVPDSIAEDAPTQTQQFAGGPTVERILSLLAESGFDVELVTRSWSRPVRSGTILAGVPVTGPQICGASPDCAAWQAAGCPKALSGLDPAMSTSIVDVANLAGSQRFLHMSGPLVGWLGATNVEFWSRGCARVFRDPVHGSAVLTIPENARWMTIPSSIGPVRWELR